MKKYGRERIKKLYEEVGLPKNTKFRGYVLHLPESDEFLASAERIDNYGSINYMWSKIPDLALIFKKHIKAVRELQEYGKNNVTLCLLLDTGPQLIRIPEEEALEILLDK
jgi:hypothetical protein